jgi:hypothetical protein
VITNRRKDSVTILTHHELVGRIQGQFPGHQETIGEPVDFPFRRKKLKQKLKGDEKMPQGLRF